MFDDTMLDPAGPVSAVTRDLFFDAVGLMLIVIVPVFVLTGLILWRYRAGGTAKYTPKFLQSRTSNFRIEVSFEKGDVESNTRRAQPPVDNLTYFFLPQSEGGLAGQTVNRLNPAHESRLYVDYGTPQQRLNPLISNAWGNGTLILVYDGSAQPVSIFEKEINSANGYRISGTTALFNNPTAVGSSATSISGTVQPVFFNGFAAYATLKGLPFANRYQDRVLTDTNIYNFYEKLIDGNSKRELRDWTNGRIDLSHSFFNNRLSYNLQYFKEKMDFDRYAALGSNSTIEVDAGELLPDGRPNPNVGQAYIRESPFTGSRAQFADRDAWRAVLFAQHDFRKRSGNRILRSLGQHMFTGTLSQQNVEQKRFDYMSNGVGEDWLATRHVTSNPSLMNQFNTPARTLNYFYISGNLTGKQLGQDLGLRNVGAEPGELCRMDERHRETLRRADRRGLARVPHACARLLQGAHRLEGARVAGQVSQRRGRRHVRLARGQLSLMGVRVDDKSGRPRSGARGFPL